MKTKQSLPILRSARLAVAAYKMSRRHSTNVFATYGVLKACNAAMEQTNQPAPEQSAI